MGTTYEQSEWLEFMAGAPPGALPTHLADMRDKFTDVTCDLFADLYGPEPDDRDKLAYLAFASIGGYGIGLWEGEEAHHAEFHEVVCGNQWLKDLAEDIEVEALEL